MLAEWLYWMIAEVVWPGVQRVARFINTLPHYKLLEGHKKIKDGVKKKTVRFFLSFIVTMIPFKKIFFSTVDFSTDEQLGLNYSCIAFQKIGEDTRRWDWDKGF